MSKIKQRTSTETIDIDKESNDLPVLSDGSLELLDKQNKIKTHWLKERIIVWLSVTVILTILFTSVITLFFSGDESSQDWGRQILSTLVGFAAGAIWQTKKSD